MEPRETLKSYLADREIKAAEFARLISYDKGNLHKILNGGLWPSLEVALRIEQQTAGVVPMTAWAVAKAAA